MKNLINAVLMGSLVVVFASCKSGGNGGGAPGHSHNQLADEFVAQLNLESDFNVDLVKSSTLQNDYIVIYDPLYGSYDAVFIGNYDPAYDNAADYYQNNQGSLFVELDRVSGHYEYDFELVYVGVDEYGYDVYDEQTVETWVPTRYHDYATGLVFEKTQATAKDLAKVVAIKEVAQISKTAEFLSSKFGLSLNRGREIAKLSAHWKKASKKGMTAADQDKFSEELLGFSISSAQSAYKQSLEGNSSAIEDLVEQSASVNDITPEHAEQLMTKLFSL